MIIPFITTNDNREGELIFRYVYDFLECKKPFQRLWISSLTDRAIKEGFDKLRPGSDYDLLYQAAKARRESDWMVGINASQALTIAAGRGNFSLGRVQTPTLAMICHRYLENKDFKVQMYYQLQLTTEKKKIEIVATNPEKYDTKVAAEKVLEPALQAKDASVVSVTEKELIEKPPLPYDLTALQKHANTLHGYTADQTLQAAQQLYEMQLISYPRTGSQYFSKDLFETLPEILRSLKGNIAFGEYAENLLSQGLNDHAVNDGKVTDHHALVITEKNPGTLSVPQRLIYNLILVRMLATLSGKCHKIITDIIFDAGGIQFLAKSSRITVPGWRGADNPEDDGDEKEMNLPELTEGEHLPIKALDCVGKKTKPKPLYTDATLLAAMETAGRNLDDDEQREAMRDCGLGTPATRAGIIELIINRDYVSREKKSLVPTEKGLNVYNAIKDQRIADVEMTGEWEATLSKIESGQINPDTFRKDIEVYTHEITREVLTSSIAGVTFTHVDCPKCGKGTVYFYNKVAKCNNSECGLLIYRLICGKNMTDAQLLTILGGKKTAILKGFSNRKGKKFEASLQLDEMFRVKMNQDY